METLPSTTALPPIREEVLRGSPQGESPLHAELHVEAGIARGHLEWASNCRRVELVRAREQELVETKPSAEAGMAAGLGALVTGAAGAALLNNLDEFSDTDACHLDTDGNKSCSSPRSDATFGGVLLVTSAVALTVTSIATAVSTSSTTYGDVHTAEVLTRRVLAENARCGSGAVAELALSLYLAEQRIAASVTDEHGDVAFSVPTWVTGTLTLRVDSAPRKYEAIRPGQAVGTLRIEPVPASPETVPW